MKYIRHRAFRHRWSELMWKTIPDVHICDLCRAPPRLAYTRIQSHDFFRFFFWCHKMKLIGSKTRALATHKSTKKH